MKAQYSRSRVQNGPVSRRAARGEKPVSKPVNRPVRKPATKPVSKLAAKAMTKNVAKSLERASRRRRSTAPARESDSRVYWLMVLFGALLTAGFLLGLRSQINAHQLNRAEEKLRDELDRYASQEKFLNLDQKRALSPRESERFVKEAGLLQVKLDEKNALAQLPAKLDPPNTSNPLPPLAAQKSAGKSVVVKASFDKHLADRSRTGLKTSKTVDGKTVKSKPMGGKQFDLFSSKRKAVAAPKALQGQSPKAKRNGSGNRQVTRTSERR